MPERRRTQMKILHTADWHIGQFKGPVVDGVNLRLQDTVKCLEYMVEVAQKEKPDIVCISGDIFHQEQIGPVRYSDEMIIATDTITKLADIAKGVIVMRGTPNHDGSGQFRVLDRMFAKTSHVHIITAPTVLHTPYTDIACIPGFDKQEFRAKFPGLSADEENLAWSKYISDMVFALRAECEKTPILMAHYTVPGCNMESGQTSFFTNFEPVIPRETLMAARYEAVFLGHIHRPQIIEGFDNVFYSGAINAMNFNDEGQDRGFWIHEFNEKGTLVKGHRYTTPYRQFQTITWDSDEVGDYIREGIMYLHRTELPEKVADKIVRVRYSCTSEQKKALNIPLLQKNLYELGAFYVADIEAESTIDITNRGLLSEESDPRLNLKKWLEEKTFKNPDKIVELAEPIIAEAMKQSTTAEIHGVFKPVSISVRNYRNYKEESFDTFEMAHNALKAHGRAVQMLRTYGKQKLTIGYAPTSSVCYPETDRPEDIEAARKAYFSLQEDDSNWTWNVSWWSDPVLLGHYPEEGLERYEKYLPKITEEDMRLISEPIDIYGQNIYNGRCFRMGEDGKPQEVCRYEGFPKTAIQWPVTPECLRWGPKFLYERYHKPIYITENGLSCHDVISLDGKVHDPNRIDFLARYLQELKKAAEEVDIRGYFQWSLMDNFEWAKGYSDRFGLVYVDYRNQQRIMKDSAFWYKHVIETNGVEL
jgi:exonuclease SbcD